MEIRVLHLVNRFWIGGAAALVVVAAVVAFAARGSGASPPSGTPAAGGSCGRSTAAPSTSHPIVSPPATLPPVGDVPFYRANAQRTSVYPGPGPVCQPAIAWQQRLGKAANFTPIVVADCTGLGSLGSTAALTWSGGNGGSGFSAFGLAFAHSSGLGVA